jgi:hypothetical protein
MQIKIVGSVLVSFCLSSTIAFADTYVQGHMRKDGSYVQGHYKTEANNTKLDNYSTRGNINPYTSKPGYVDPYRERNSDNANPYSSRKSSRVNPY